MKLTKNEWMRGTGRQIRQYRVVAVLIAIGLLGMALAQVASAQALSTTTVQGTVYLANGQAGSGTLRVSWPAFTTANGQMVAADSTTVTIAPDGFVSVNLAPNLGATPAGLYYTAVFYLSDGTTSTQYWVVPSAAQASLAQVQSQLMPAAQAVQAVSKAYVDQSIAELNQSQLTASGGTLTGPLYLNADPTQALQASDKHYVDTAVSEAVPISLTPANSGQIAYYTGNGTSLGGMNTVPLSAGGTGAASAAAALQNLGGISAIATSQQTLGGPVGWSSVANAQQTLVNMNGQGPVINVLNLGVVAGGSLGGSLSTDTANTAALQSAINAAFAAHGELYFPCGIYNFNSPLTVYGTQSIAIEGQAWGCSILQYTGTTAVTQGMITVAGSAPATNCTSVTCNHTTGMPAHGSSGFRLENISLVGNANVPDGLDLLVAAQFHLKDIAVAGGSNAEIYCQTCQQGQMDVPLVGSGVLFALGGFSANATPNGIVLDGYSSDLSATANHVGINSMTADWMTGKALWLRNSTQNVFTNCQLSSNAVNIQIDQAGGDTFDECMSEPGTSYGVGDLNIASGATNETFLGSAVYGPVNISGSLNHFIGGSIGTTTIASTAHGNVFDGAAVANPGSYLTDNAPDTEYRAFYDVTTGLPPVNFPASRRTPPPQGGSCSGVLFLTGAWNTSGAAVNLDPAPLCGLTGGWRAIFTGVWIGPGGFENLPSTYEFANFVSSLTLPSGGSVSISVSSGHLQMATSGAGGAVYFSGSIQFIPYAWGSSYSFASGISAYSVTINGGTPMGGSAGTGGYAQETTNAAKTNGNLAVFDASGNTVNGPAPPASAIVGASDTQTLTNKSIAGSEINSGTVGAAYGGTGQNESSATGIGQWSSGTYSVSTALPNGTTVTTQTAGDNSTKIATTAYVATAIPSALPPNGSAGGDLSGSYPSPTVAQISGAAVPASASGVATNSSKQLVAQTAHNASVIRTCSASGSVNTYSCTTSPTFTPSAGDEIHLNVNMANTGSSTLAVNGGSASTIYKNGGTLTLVSGDLQTNHWISAIFDSNNHWQLEGQLGNTTATNLTGTPTLPNGTAATTQSAGDNSTKLATTAYVASPGAITPTTIAASGIISGGNDTTRTTTATMTNSFTSTGLVLPTVPVSTIKNGRCVVLWQMSSTSYTATFGFGMSNAPTNLWGAAKVIYAAAGSQNYLAFSQTATAPTAISTAATAGATGTTYEADVDFTLQTGSTNTVALTLYGETSNSGATLTIEPGSECHWLP